MKSLRLDPELEDRLQRAAVARGETLSEFIRRAAAARADETLDAEATGFDDVLGAIHGGGGQARRTGRSFTEILVERRAAE